MKMKEKQKKRKAYEPKLTQEELMDSSTFKRFLTSIDNILDNLEDVDFTTMGKRLERTTECFGLNHSRALLFVLCVLFFFFFFIQLMTMKYLKNCFLGSTSWMSSAASLQRSRPWESPAGYLVFAFSGTLAVICSFAFGCSLDHVPWNPVSDSLWQTGKAVEYSGKEHLGWVKAFHTDESRKRFLLW